MNGINWQCPFDKPATGLIHVYTDRWAGMEPGKNAGPMHSANGCLLLIRPVLVEKRTTATR